MSAFPGLQPDRYPGGLRSGQDFLDALADDGRQIFIDGEAVRDVTRHPAFSGAARTLAELFDIARDPSNRERMTFVSPSSGERVNRIWQQPRSVEELNERRGAIELWAEHHLGFMGRAPDHVAGFFSGFAAEPEVLAQPGNEAFAHNAVALYEFFRDNDVYVSYTIVPPQIDRSKPAHLQSPSDLYAGVVEERDDGVIVRGAQMLGTGTVFSDCLHLSTIHPLQPGDENHAVSLAVACNSPGLKIYPRRSYATTANSTFDYPLSSRFDETDALVVFDDVFVPWEQIFVYKHLGAVRDQWFETPAHVFGNNQAQIRFLKKLQFLIGLARTITAMNGVAGLPPVQAQIAEMAVDAATYEGLIDAQIARAAPNRNGIFVPHRQSHYAAMSLQSQIYPRLLETLRELSGGGMIQLPASADDLRSEDAGADIRRYVQSPEIDAEERVKLLKLAWDAVGSEFGGRHAQYEKFYAGAPFIVKTRFSWNYDFDSAENLVKRAMEKYSL